MIVTINWDSEGEGLSDDLENSTGTNPNAADTDDDGIPDGVEDGNQNGIWNVAETDPRKIDSDYDGI